MQTIKLLAGALAFVSLGALATAAEPSIDPTGNWQTVGGESRYSVSLCGDGTQLCARLTWLRDDMRTDHNVPYLNKLVVNRARLASENRWQGEVTYDGDTFTGSVTLESDDSMRMMGCKGIFCQSMRFERI